MRQEKNNMRLCGTDPCSRTIVGASFSALGQISYRHIPGVTAKQRIEYLGGSWWTTTVKTTGVWFDKTADGQDEPPAQWLDTYLDSQAKALDGTFRLYVLYYYDCGTFCNEWLDYARSLGGK